MREGLRARTGESRDVPIICSNASKTTHATSVVAKEQQRYPLNAPHLPTYLLAYRMGVGIVYEGIRKGVVESRALAINARSSTRFISGYTSSMQLLQQDKHYATTPSDLKLVISSRVIPSISASSSSVCWPSVGGGDRMLGSENEYLTGGLTSFMGPQSGCSTSVTMLRAWTS